MGTCRLTGADGKELLRITPGGRKSRPVLSVTLHPSSEEETTTLLATLAACYALLLLQPPGVPSAGI
jgi:hypothetical protein